MDIENDKTLAQRGHGELGCNVTYSENEIEAMLAPQTRIITDAKGKEIKLEQSVLFWTMFDTLIQEWSFTEAQLIGYGYDTTQEFGLPFSLAIQDAVSHLYKDWTAPDEQGSYSAI